MARIKTMEEMLKDKHYSGWEFPDPKKHTLGLKITDEFYNRLKNEIRVSSNRDSFITNHNDSLDYKWNFELWMVTEDSLCIDDIMPTLNQNI